MQKEKIMSKPDNFMMRSTASIGVSIGMHQDLVHHDSFHLFLCQILQTVDLTETVFEEFYSKGKEEIPETNNKRKIEESKTTDRENLENIMQIEPQSHRYIPSFEIGIGTLSYVDKVDIRCAKEEARLLKEIFRLVDFRLWLKDGHFIPRGLIQLWNKTDVYKAIIKQHQQFLSNTVCFAAVGLSPAAAEYKLQVEKSEPMTPIQLLMIPECIRALYPTASTKEKGRWLIIITKEKFNEAIKFFDEEI
jgi:hypothetical protein